MSFTSRRIGRSLAFILIICASLASVSYGQGTLDQENNPVWQGGATNFVPENEVSQTFTPTLPYLVGVETALTTGNPGQGGDVVTLTVIGSAGQASTSAFIPEGFEGFWRFDLPGFELTPGETPTMILKDTGKVTFFWMYASDTYLPGQAFFGGGPFDDHDFLFRTYGAENASVFLTDLEGTWDVNSLASNTLPSEPGGAPWWFRAPLKVSADGTFAGTGTDSDGWQGPESGRFEIKPDGSIIMQLFPSNKTTPMYLDTGKTVMTTSSTWDQAVPRTSDMAVVTKRAASYKQSDLAGTWESNSLATGPGAPWWERSSATIQTNGALSYIGTDSNNEPSIGSGTLALSRTGVVTLRGKPAFRGNLDAGKTVLVVTDTWPSDGTTELKVILKKAASYSQSDLAGRWQGNTLASGPGAPWWSKSSVTINADGTYVDSSIDSDNVTTTKTGTMSMTAGGIVTCTVAPGTDPAASGAMDAHKTVMAFTSTRPADGTTELKVLTKCLAPSTVAASFSASPASGKAPLKVTFSDTSTGAISSWHWDFGDGKTSTQQNPVYTYRKAGTYDVTLTASGPGGTSTVTQTAYIKAYAVPKANFTATPRRGTYPLNVTFANKSTGTIETFSWTFGDGGSSDVANPTHEYTGAGTYTVTLVATGPLGSSTKTQTVTVTAPRTP